MGARASRARTREVADGRQVRRVRLVEKRGVDHPGADDAHPDPVLLRPRARRLDAQARRPRAWSSRTGRSRAPGTRPASEAVLTMWPRPWLHMTGYAARTPWTTPRKLTSIVAVEVGEGHVAHLATDPDPGVVEHQVEVAVVGWRCRSTSSFSASGSLTSRDADDARPGGPACSSSAAALGSDLRRRRRTRPMHPGRRAPMRWPARYPMRRP